MNNKGLLLFLAVLVLIMLFNTDIEAQCSMCRKIANDGANKNIGGTVSNNLNTAILYLMIIPYFLLAFIFRKQLKSLFKSLRS